MWSPDGRRLLFTNEADLYEASPDGSDAGKLDTLSPRIGDVRGSPDGQKIRITVDDVRTGISEYWELNRDGGHPILPTGTLLPTDAAGNGRRMEDIFSSLAAAGSEVIRQKLSDGCLHRFIAARSFSRNSFGSRNYHLYSGSRTVGLNTHRPG